MMSSIPFGLMSLRNSFMVCFIPTAIDTQPLKSRPQYRILAWTGWPSASVVSSPAQVPRTGRCAGDCRSHRRPCPGPGSCEHSASRTLPSCFNKNNSIQNFFFPRSSAFQSVRSHVELLFCTFDGYTLDRADITVHFSCSLFNHQTRSNFIVRNSMMVSLHMECCCTSTVQNLSLIHI